MILKNDRKLKEKGTESGHEHSQPATMTSFTLRQNPGTEPKIAHPHSAKRRIPETGTWCSVRLANTCRSGVAAMAL